MPLAKLKSKGQITIPKPVRDQLGLSEGDLVEIDVQGGKGIITPQRVVAAAPVPKLSAQQQRALARARKKIEIINQDLRMSKGLTVEEAGVAAKVGIIDPGEVWFWLEDWQKGEREAESDIKDGRLSGPFETAEDLLAHLHRQSA